MSNKVFCDGLIAKRSQQAPDFVLCNLSFKIEEFKTFLDTYDKNGWVNIDVKKSKNGKIYGELNEWKPDNKKQETSDEVSVEDLPF